MGLSIADIERWSPESISAVGAASAARADAATQASSQLKGLSAFNHWQGDGAAAAQASTQVFAAGLDRHGQAASAIATAANTAANEVRQIKNQLNELRTTLGQYGIIIDPSGSRVVPPPNLSSLPPAQRNLVQSTATIGQQSLDKIRQAADLADTHLAGAMKPKGDEFDLDTQYARPAGLRGEVPGGVITDVTAITTAVTAGTAVTVATHSKFYGCGSAGKHCK